MSKTVSEDMHRLVLRRSIRYHRALAHLMDKLELETLELPIDAVEQLPKDGDSLIFVSENDDVVRFQKFSFIQDG